FRPGRNGVQLFRLPTAQRLCDRRRDGGSQGRILLPASSQPSNTQLQLLKLHGALSVGDIPRSYPSQQRGVGNDLQQAITDTGHVSLDVGCAGSSAQSLCAAGREQCWGRCSIGIYRGGLHIGQPVAALGLAAYFQNKTMAREPLM